jgi:hypothetical protein
MQFFQSFVEKIREAAQERAAMTNKFTAQQILKMSGILLSAEFKSTRMKSSKVSAWNLFQSDMKATIPDNIRCPTQSDGLRPKFTGEYAKTVAEQWPDHRDEYMEKANVINKAGDTLTKVPIALHQKRTVKKLTELVCHSGAHPHRV